MRRSRRYVVYGRKQIELEDIGNLLRMMQEREVEVWEDIYAKNYVRKKRWGSWNPEDLMRKFF